MIPMNNTNYRASYTHNLRFSVLYGSTRSYSDGITMGRTIRFTGEAYTMLSSIKNREHRLLLKAYGDKLFENAFISDYVKLAGNAIIKGYGKLCGYATVSGRSVIQGLALVCGEATVGGVSILEGDVTISKGRIMDVHWWRNIP